MDVARYRRKLENPSPISIRAANRERAEQLERPTEYDRVVVRIASVYALSHWVDETTIRNYLTKYFCSVDTMELIINTYHPVVRRRQCRAGATGDSRGTVLGRYTLSSAPRGHRGGSLKNFERRKSRC